MSTYFTRNLQFNNTLYMGDPLKKINIKKIQGVQKKRVSIRFRSADYERIRSLAFAMDVTNSTATAILLDASIRNSAIVNRYLQQHIEANLSEGRMRELRQIIRFINRNNPYDDAFTFSELISMIYKDCKQGALNIGKALEEWIKGVNEN